MAIRVSSWPGRAGLLEALVADVRLAVRLLREPLVPLLVKAVPAGALLYVVSPLDVIPDVIPVVGQLDDLGIILMALKVFLRLCPEAAAFHRDAIGRGRRFSPMSPADSVIDAEFRRE